MSIRKESPIRLADLADVGVDEGVAVLDDGDAGWPERLRQAIALAGSASALAKGAGISQSGLSRYLAGGEPSRRVLVALARAAGVRLLWLATGEGPMDLRDPDAPPRPGNLTLLPFYRLGDGQRHEVTDSDKPHFTSQAFCRFWLRSNGLDSERLAVLQVRGQSMSPTLLDGDIVLVDERDRHLEDDKVYLIRDSGHLLIRRLQLELGGRVRVLSDNPAHRESTLRVDEIEILGRITWRGSVM